MKGVDFVMVLLPLFLGVHIQNSVRMNHQLQQDFSNKKLLYTDGFDKDLKNWVIEIPATPASSVSIKDHKLLIDVDGGATVWLKKKLSGNLMITYKRKVLVDTGRNDRLSDLNQFWMANDPENENLFTRKGVFFEYDSLLLYYVGFGGNSNTTTRFRKYTGKGERVLYKDLTDREHLLKPNKAYAIKIVAYNGLSKFFVDGKEFFSFCDLNPVTKGYFGFRTTQSRQEIDDFKIYQLK